MQADGIGEHQRPEKPHAVAVTSERLGVAKMRMRVHQSDLAAEKGCGLGALKDLHRSAAIGGGPVKKARAVRANQTLIDQRQVSLGLVQREQV